MRRNPPSTRLRRGAFVLLGALLALTGAVVPAQAEPPGPLPPDLSARLTADGGATDFWVEFKEQATLKSAAAIKDWSARGEAVLRELRSTADSSQARALGLVRAAGAEATSLYIDNSLYVRGGSAELASKLAGDPAVERVRVPRTYTLPRPTPGERAAASGPVEWGVSAIHADQVWSEYKSTGQGIVVGNIDSGVDYTHPALAGSYRGANGDGGFTHDYNWYDPTALCAEAAPCDNFGHGTHTMGTMTGGEGIGVAPGARWIAAKGCRDYQCGELTLALSAQWMLAPAKADGSDPDPARRPNILNNSWSSGTGNPWYQDYVRQWVAAGIFPVFAAGNDGPACGTQHSPGEYPESYAVGAVDQNGNVAGFSSRGEAGLPDSKPDIAAPGQNVRSSMPGGGYQVQQGTSMAAPHVSGAVALLWSAAPALVGDVAATRAILGGTARDHADTTCGGTDGDNNVYGEGMLDVYRAVGATPRTGTGVLTGQVTDRSTGKPVAGARVTATGPRVLDTTTGADGVYLLHLDEGDYDVALSLFGYDAAKLGGVRVTGDESTTKDVALSPTPTKKVTVRVADGSDHGWPLYAELSVEGAPATWFTAPGDGRARLDLPVGGTYEVTATPRYPGYRPVTAQVSGTTLELKAETDPAACSAPGYAADGGTCAPVAGGLVYGNVTDANTRKPVDGATVTPDGGAGHDTAATPDDPALADGFYWAFAPMPGAGRRVLTAVQRGYQSATVPLRSGADQVSRADFALKAGRLSVSTDEVTERAQLGGRAKVRVTLTNRGSAPLTYDLAGAKGSALAQAQGQGAPATRIETPGLTPAARTPATGPENGPENGAEYGAENGATPEPAAAATDGGTRAADGGTPAAAPWTDISNYPTTIRDNAVGYHDGRVYSFGGSLRGEGGTPASYVYDPAAKTWTRLADMPDARQKPASAFVDGKFYVVTGWGQDGTPAARTLVYDPEADTWSTGADNPHPWGAVGSAVLNGKIYTVGGCTGECQSATDQVTVYDVASDTFTEAAPYPEPISWVACGGIDGKVHCAGGLAAGPHGTTHAYVYDPARNAWSKSADLPIDLWASGYAVAGGRLVVAGGVTNGGSALTNEAFAYDPDADAWTALPNSRNALYRGAAACGLYKIGGANGPRVTPFGEVLPTLDACDPAGTAAPWLSADPGHGTLAPGRSVRVTLTLDAREIAEPGTYEARLTVNEDTPYPAPAIDVTLKADAPWHWARLSGEVSSKACDGKASPLPGATVTLRRGRDTWTATTDTQGRYSLWLPGGLVKQEVKVSADGHKPASFNVRLLPHTQIRHDTTLPRTAC
ncbi:S8 family serine peptidase [Nonomuraea fuscirosea]|uniref:S8 family serine peptidase n=1 Tax=Nonomuraea fuscirosea TaxID=1291556 RepID=UPI002DDC5321|nr:S8 family serine peptidase [Nonomuraea fuscirosea]WSA53891.1 S8 family serine peptidase [Nonomuraea fuscirosea]